MQAISYLSECLNNDRLIRWPASTMPIKVYIAPFRWYKARHEGYNYRSIVMNALKVWQDASQNKVSFSMVNNLNDSQINIEWKRVERAALGHCIFNFDNQSRLYSAEVQIGLSDGLIHSQYQDKGEVFHTILHEVGHALGLNHSPYKDDIMYVPHQYGVVNISERDKLTLKWLYSFPYGSTRQEILSKYRFSSQYTLDHLIYKLETQDEMGELEKPGPASQENSEKILDEEQQILANMNKYNLSLQNINVSSNIQDYIKKTLIKRNFKNKNDF